MLQVFTYDKILMHALEVTFLARPESVLRIIHVYFNFNTDQASKVNLCITYDYSL